MQVRRRAVRGVAVAGEAVVEDDPERPATSATGARARRLPAVDARELDHSGPVAVGRHEIHSEAERVLAVDRVRRAAVAVGDADAERTDEHHDVRNDPAVAPLAGYAWDVAQPDAL